MIVVILVVAYWAGNLEKRIDNLKVQFLEFVP